MGEFAKMGFSSEIRENALVKAARCCCVCRRFRGVGVEVHHIVPALDGGSSDLDNAIVLCFDCHCAAGHYNPKHPRGTKYSPRELRRHRDNWYRSVEEAGAQLREDDEFSGYYGRHLICLDNEAARDLIAANKDQIPFRYDYLLKNDVFRFMAEVLDDNLPFSWTGSDNQLGHYRGRGDYSSLEDFHDQHPEFEKQFSRPLTATDIVEGGLVPSKMMRKIVDNGFPPSELGKVCAEVDDCGGGVSYFVAMRRPLFVFAEIRNTSSEQFRLSGLVTRKDKDRPFVCKFDDWDEGKLAAIPYGNLVLNPGEVLLIPECVLLSSQNHDPLNTEFVEMEDMSHEQMQAVGFRTTAMKDDFYRFGPALKLEGFDLEVGNEIRNVPIHRFDPSKCYVYYRAWMCGSCPHLYVFDKHTGWKYLGEILAKSTNNGSRTERVSIPEGVTRIRIVETDFEITHIESIDYRDQQLVERPIRLRQGDSLELEVNGPGILSVIGRYHARIMSPRCYLQLRQKLSLRSAYEHTVLG